MFLYHEIAESIRRQIAAGELQVGEALPSVREMAQRWRCTTGTVARSYRLLADEGLVVAQQGRGTRVASSRLQPDNPSWQWTKLINRAEQFLLDSLSSGYSPSQMQSALLVAISRWESLQKDGVPDTFRDQAQEANGLLRFAGSHDLLVELVSKMLTTENTRLRIGVTYTGSLGGLMALARNEADVAGVHLWDQATNRYNEPFVRRLLPGQRTALVTLAHRSQGLITRAGNPLELQSLQDLVRPGVRFINRQQGSGTRVWLDVQLQVMGINPAQIRGYEQEVVTHMDVARAVVESQAEVGLGIHAAAAAFNLTFVPLTEEQYDLVFTEASWQAEPAITLREIIAKPQFKQAVAALGGYDTAATGQTIWL